MQRRSGPAEHRPSGAVQNRIAAAFGWEYLFAWNAAQSADRCSIPVVSAVHAERGAAPFFHGELQLPAPVYFVDHRGSVSMVIGGGGQCGNTDPSSSIYRRDAHQGKRKSEQKNQAGSTGSSKTIPGRTAGGSERGPGGSWKKATG